MNAQSLAQRAYAAENAPTRSARSIEYEVVARVTHRIKAAVEKGPTCFPELARALHDNVELWTTLAADVSDAGNALPRDLRARIFYLAEFTRQHTRKILAGSESAVPLLEINTAILRGLRQVEPT